MKNYKEIEHTIITEYRKNIWNKFSKAIKEYELVKDSDKIAVCISGGKDSMLLAKCMQQLKRNNEINFELVFLVMNPGYTDENIQKIKENGKRLNIPIQIFNTKIFEAIDKVESHPCFICSSIRRKKLYLKAKELGCNKIALGHHLNDVIETTLMSIIYGANFKTMLPKLNSRFHEGMQVIRPLYLIKEEDIISWKEYNELEFIDCACKVTKTKQTDSKRKVVKDIIQNLKKDNDKIEMNIFRSLENVNVNTLISYIQDGKKHTFLDDIKD